MNGVPRPAMESSLIKEFEKGFAAMGQVLAKLVACNGGSYRVVECQTCIHNNKKVVFLEITLPELGNLYIALHEYNVLSENVIKLDTPPPNSISADQLLGWVQGISIVK